MDNAKSREALLEFLEYLAQKGLMAHATTQARKASVNKVLGILSQTEAQDVTMIDLDEVMTRFMNLQGKGYNPTSLVTYKGRVRSALDDFARYIDNPLGFKPSVQARERKPNQMKVSSGKPSADPVAIEPNSSSSSPVIAGPMAKSILPIPIREDLTVYIQGLPFDLKESEAKRISNVVTAMAMIP